ncbi:hypothetical protein NE237_001198 [Protea cynaroides]|uniref:Uncharacterized protein n=1 Tax=Protea cynaroides TaxID=273540 RepID=A0A9Q0QY62_9MAGN|nr:hypothetical protein NE237_001198 [Protea cynaroides]
MSTYFLSIVLVPSPVCNNVEMIIWKFLRDGWELKDMKSFSTKCGKSRSLSRFKITKPVGDEHAASPTVELQRLVEQYISHNLGIAALKYKATGCPHDGNLCLEEWVGGCGRLVNLVNDGLLEDVDEFWTLICVTNHIDKLASSSRGYLDSEAVALKRYPQYEAVPCDQFEAAFKALAQCENTLSKLGVVRECG